ncbi:MAG: PAS domain-containing protein [Burkholderiaceae bacterium]
MIKANTSRRAGAVLGLVAAVGGAVSFAGWPSNIRYLASWQGDAIAMQPNACIAMVLSGVGLALHAHGARRVVAALGVAVALIGGLTLLQDLTGLALGIDGPFTFGRDWALGTSASGRMGPPASLSFTLIGFALILLGAPPEADRAARQRRIPVLALIVGTLALFSLIGYAFGAERLYAVPRLTAIALQTALLLALVSAGLFLAVPEYEPVRTLTARSSASSLARFVIPLLVVLPIVLGSLFIQGERWKLYDTATGLAIRTLLIILIGVGLMWWALTALRRGEERERTATQRIADFLGSITDAFYVVDREWRVPFLNDEAARRMNRPRAQIRSDALWELLPTLEAQMRPPLEHAMSARTSVEYEVHDVASDRWSHEKAFPTADGGLAVYAQDITDRKRAEAVAEQRQKLLQFTIDGIPAFVYIKDAEGRQLMVNDRFCQLVGRQREELIGRTDEEIFPGPTQERIRANDRRVFEENRAMEFEEWLDLPEGRRQYLSTKVPAEGVGFEGRVLVGISLDITERKRDEEALRVSEERLQLAAQGAGIGIWELDLRTGVGYWSAEAVALIGSGRSEFTAADWMAAVHPDDRERAEAAWKRTVEDGAPYEIEYRATTPANDGEERWLLCRGRIERGPDGAAEKGLGILMDVSVRRHTEDALREADRHKDEFLATLSHELRNPLAPIGNAVELLCRPGATEQSVTWARQVLQRQVRTMGLLLDDLLDLSRITQGKLRLKKKAIRLNSIIDAAVETARPMLDAKRHALSVALPDSPVQLFADPLRLSQVVANLLNNASRYTEAGGQIAVQASASGDEVRIAVRDNGSGLASDELSRIFEMFAQGKAARKADGGLGIGLALARGILEMHEGRLEAFSEGPGKGSTFVVTIPLLKPEPAADTSPMMKQGTSPLRRVLVADDNKDGAESMAMLVQMEGHEVRVAYDGASALAIANAFKPEVALLDIGMPELSGDQVAARIREQAWSANTVIVAITGWGQEEDRVKTLAAGFDRHLTKPVDFEQLRRILAEPRTAFAKVIALDRGKAQLHG